jgi:hypothetical protein
MLIVRRGTSRNHGQSSIELKKPTVAWDSPTEAVVVCSRNVRDFATLACHNYTITISRDELRLLLETLLHAAPGAKEVRDERAA